MTDIPSTPISRLSRRLESHAWLLLPFLGFFALYQLSLAMNPEPIPEYPSWSFAADNRETIYQGVIRGGNAFSITKHPLFFFVGRILFIVGSALYSFIPGAIGYNLTVTFPMAVVGSVGACAAIMLFRQAHRDKFAAIVFGLLFALSTCAWIFSSFPDTYALTALATIVFFLTLLQPQTTKRALYIVAVANALACYASPQQIALGVIPCLYYLQQNWVSREAWTKVARYSVAMIVLYIIPFFILLQLARFGAATPFEYVKNQSVFDAGYVAVVPVNLLIFGLIGPAVPGELYADLNFSAFTAAPSWWFFLLAAFGIFALGCLVGLKRSTSRFAQYTPGIIAFIIINIVFFVFFNPAECYLMSLPLLVPILLLLHTGAAGNHKIIWQLFLVFFLVSVVVNNTAVVAFMHTLM